MIPGAYILDSQILEIVIKVFQAICLLFCFVKMGIDPWAALVPLYGQYCLWDEIWGNGLICAILYYGSMLAAIGLPILVWVGFIFQIITHWMVFARFGKGLVFSILGVLFPAPALAICAFGKSTYCR